MPGFRGLSGFLISVIVVLVFRYLDNIPAEDEDWNVRIGADMEELRSDFKNKNMSAFVVGYTGEVGKVLVRELLTSGVFARVVLIGRRPVDFTDGLYDSVEQEVVDFDKIEEYSEVFQGLDVGFCALGTTRGKSGAAGFYKVDHDYVMGTAQVAKRAGCKHFHLVSSQGANKNAWFLYTKTKGEVEEELKAVGFDRLSIYRPAVLMCDREERRLGEAMIRTLFKPVAAAFPTAITTPTTTVAKAMVNCAVSPPHSDTQKWELFENKAIHQLAGEIGKTPK